MIFLIILYEVSLLSISDLKESLKSNGLAISLGLVALNAIFISLSAITFMVSIDKTCTCGPIKPSTVDYCVYSEF